MSLLDHVSILIPSFLRPGFLRECLLGIAANLFECQTIVVDDSGPLLRELAIPTGVNCQLVSLPFDSGLSAKRNAGVRVCQTKYVLLAHDDQDFRSPETRAGVETLAWVLNAYPSVDVAAG